MVIQARLVGLDLGVPWIIIQRFGNDTQSQRPNFGDTSASNTRTGLDTASDQLQQPLWGRDLCAGDRYTGLLPIMAELEIRAGNSRAGGLPKRAAGNMA